MNDQNPFNSFIIDGHHQILDKSQIDDSKKNDYSALAPAGRNIPKDQLQQLQMFARDIEEEAPNTAQPKAKGRHEFASKDD